MARQWQNSGGSYVYEETAREYQDADGGFINADAPTEIVRSAQIPGGPFVHDTDSGESQIPGGPYLNQTQASGGAAAVSLTADKVAITFTGKAAGLDVSVPHNKGAITLTGKDSTFDVVLGFRPFRAVHATAIA